MLMMVSRFLHYFLDALSDDVRISDSAVYVACGEDRFPVSAVSRDDDGDLIITFSHS